jgi:hypothetical protein
MAASMPPLLHPHHSLLLHLYPQNRHSPTCPHHLCCHCCCHPCHLLACFPASSYPMVTQAPSMSILLSTFLPFPAFILLQPLHSPAPTPALALVTSLLPNPNPTPALTLQHTPSQHMPTPVQPPQMKPAPAPAHMASSFQLLYDTAHL